MYGDITPDYIIAIVMKHGVILMVYALSHVMYMK